MALLEGLKVCGLLSDQGGCGNYRLFHPLTIARRLGAKVGTYVRINYPELTNFDVVIGQRIVNDQLTKILNVTRAANKLVIVETDDYLHRIPVNNPAYNTYMKGGKPDLGIYAQNLALANGLTVSTPELKEFYSKTNNNIEVVPNLIDFDIREWPDPQFNDGSKPIRVGWTGSSSHIVDIDIIGPVLKEILTKYPSVRYVHYSTDVILEHLLTKYKLPPDQIDFMPPVSFNSHPSNMIHFDIGLAPLDSNEFNRAKSDLKLKEYSAVGVPFVASKLAPYHRYTDQGMDGFTCTNNREWVEAVSLLIEDTQKRKDMADYAYTKAREKCDLTKNFHLWLEAWKRIAINANSNNKPEVVEAKYTKVGRNDPCPCGSGSKYKKCCSPAYG